MVNPIENRILADDHYLCPTTNTILIVNIRNAFRTIIDSMKCFSNLPLLTTGEALDQKRYLKVDEKLEIH